MVSPFVTYCLPIHLTFVKKVRNEIAVLKRISSGHRNIVTLHDYFEVCRSRLIQEIFLIPNLRHLTIFTSVSTSARAESSSIASAQRATTMKRESLVDDSHLLSLINQNRDAASLVKTLFKAVRYVHDSGIVHRGKSALQFVHDIRIFIHCQI